MTTSQTQAKIAEAPPASASGVLILCNVDGVMIEPEPEAHVAAHLDALRDIWGIDIYREEFWKACENGLSDRAIARQLLRYRGIDTDPIPTDQVDRWLTRIGELFALYTSLAELHPEALPHVEEGLKRAQSIKSVQLAIATGNVEKIARLKLRLTGLEDYLPAEGGGFGDYTMKRTDIIRDALISAGWDPKDSFDRISMQHRIYLIGDTVHDIEGAREMGLHAVGMTTGGCGRAELEAAGAEAVFMRFDRAIEWILGQSEMTWTATF